MLLAASGAAILLASCSLVYASGLRTDPDTASAVVDEPVLVASRSVEPVSAGAPTYSAAAATTHARHEQTLRALEQTPGLTRRGLWGRLTREFRLPRHHPEVRYWAQYYANDRDRIYGYLQRGGPYIWYIEQQLRRQGMPLELVLLPLIESGYDANAVSKSGAVGMWQFLPGTADRFRLKRNWWYDGSRDFTASTEAALEYLDFLHGQFDDWLLAISAYNCGEGCIGRALANSRASDFWSLRIRKESREYVPKLLGMAELVSNPHTYGFRLPPLNDGPQIELIAVSGQQRLEQIAQRAGVDGHRLRAMNAGFLRHSTPPGGPHRLVIPRDGESRSGYAMPVSADRRYSSSSASPPIPRADGGTGVRSVHRVAHGDSLWYVAKLYGVQPEEIVRWNRLDSAASLQLGQQLTIYQSGAVAEDNAVFYQVRVGDSLPRIAGRFGVSVVDIMRWNILQDTRLQPGQRLKILVPHSNATGI